MRNGSLLDDAIIAEYQTLREEIGRFQDHEKEIMNFAFLALLAFATAGAAVIQYQQQQLLKPLLFFVPFTYSLLAAAYTDRTLRVLWAADYIHNTLAEQRLGSNWAVGNRSLRLGVGG